MTYWTFNSENYPVLSIYAIVVYILFSNIGLGSSVANRTCSSPKNYEGRETMKIISKFAVGLGLASLMVLLSACGTTARTTSYSATVVTPVTPYYTTTTTTYRTRVYRKKSCVGQTYYYQNYCPESWRNTGYRSCSPKRYYCW